MSPPRVSVSWYRMPEEGRSSTWNKSRSSLFSSQRERDVSGYRTFLRRWMLMIPLKIIYIAIVSAPLLSSPKTLQWSLLNSRSFVFFTCSCIHPFIQQILIEKLLCSQYIPGFEVTVVNMSESMIDLSLTRNTKIWGKNIRINLTELWELTRRL